MPKGLTRWYPHKVKPVREGIYECVIRVSRYGPMYRTTYRWDGQQFITGWPWSIVVFWRGQTRAAYLKGET